MNAESIYPGSDELSAFIKNVKFPTLTGFIRKHSENIAGWSCKLSADDGTKLYLIWKNRFIQRCRELGENYAKNSSSFHEETWDNFFKEIEQLRTIIQTSRVEGLRILTEGLKHASKNAIYSIQANQNHDFSENPLNEEQTAEILFRLYYKKCKPEPFSSDDISQIRRIISRTDKSMYMKVLSYGAETLLKENLDAKDHFAIKSSLSGIVNLLQPDLYDDFKSVFTHNEFERLNKEENFSHLASQDSDALMDELNKETADNMIDIINFKKYELGKAGRRASDEYKQLRILEEIISDFNDDSSNDKKSESTIYRKCANILDIILRGTKLELIDGENVSECSRTELEIMKNVVDFEQINTTTPSISYSYGRKVDLIIATFYNGIKYELSSNEWKSEKVSDSLIMKQQCKNLRTNACILKNVIKNNENGSKCIISMDWFGYTGYIYTLKFVDGLFVANIYDTLQIPRDMIQLKKFKSTLNTLFIWKDFLVNLKNEIITIADTLQTRERFKGIIRRRDADEMMVKVPPTLFSPKPGKRKLGEE